jgi:hypothetical protein
LRHSDQGTPFDHTDTVLTAESDQQKPQTTTLDCLLTETLLHLARLELQHACDSAAADDDDDDDDYSDDDDDDDNNNHNNKSHRSRYRNLHRSRISDRDRDGGGGGSSRNSNNNNSNCSHNSNKIKKLPLL